MVTNNSLKVIQEKVDIWIHEHGGYWPPSSMVCAVMEELGEVSREINSLEGYKPIKSGKSNLKLGEELADLLFSIICLANHYKIDLGEEINIVLDKYSERDSTRFC
jgi:NTP pyrophosphatase (non-canonical NTP hydrolase)